jgi:hypothetical protein
MTNRAPDWLAQAGHDLEHAQHALDDSDFDILIALTWAPPRLLHGR